MTITMEQLTGYEGFLQNAERAPSTREKYLRDARAFALWLGDRPLTKENTAAWKDSLIAQNKAPSTVNAAISAVNGLLVLLGREDCRLKFLHVQKKMFRDTERDLSRKEYDRLLAAAEKRKNPRTALLLETICGTGVRVSEVQYITVEALEEGKAEISMKGKIRTILFSRKLSQKLLKYAKRCGVASGPVFRTRTGKPLSRRQIWAELKTLCKEAGVEKRKVFPHNLRHLFAKTFYKVSRDVAALAALLGHSSVETTRIYLMSTAAEQVRQLDRMQLVS